MRNIVLAVIGCSLAFIAHAESWEHLNDVGNKDEQIFIDLASVKLTGINILGGNRNHDVFSVSAKVKSELPMNNSGLMRTSNSYYIEKYYVNCDNKSMALQAKEKYTENDEPLMTYVNIQEYANKKDISGGEFQQFALGTKEYGIIQETCKRATDEEHKNVITAKNKKPKTAQWINLGHINNGKTLVSLDKNSVERYSKSKYGGYLQENEYLVVGLLRSQYLDKPTSMFGGRLDRNETLRIVNCRSPGMYYTSDRKIYRVGGDEVLEMRGGNGIHKNDMLFALPKSDNQSFNVEICANL